MQVENSDTLDTSGLLKLLEQFQPQEINDPVLVDEPGERMPVAKSVAQVTNTTSLRDMPNAQPVSAGDVYSAKALVERVDAKEAVPLGQHINLWA